MKPPRHYLEWFIGQLHLLADGSLVFVTILINCKNVLVHRCCGG